MQLDARLPFCLLGSCFSDNIGGRMKQARCDVSVNPCGVLYNPLSISDAILSALTLTDNELRRATEYSILTRDDIFESWKFESLFSALDREKCIENCMNAYDRLREDLCRCGTLIITLGTAFVYYLADREDYVVANCHKQQADRFRRIRQSVPILADALVKAIEAVRNVNPDVKTVLTVSPVRHLKDGFEGNHISKSILLLAVEEVTSRLSQTVYFPAFEILCDDLRDYRFYADDLLHPSRKAVEYIWDCFKKRHFSESDRRLLEEGEKLTARLNHRSIVEGSREDQRFRAQTTHLLQTFTTNKLGK